MIRVSVVMLCLCLAACNPPKTDQQSPEIVIEGFVPVETLIPDWHDRLLLPRRQGGLDFSQVNACRDKNSSFFVLEVGSGEKLKGVASPNNDPDTQQVDLPEGIKERFNELSQRGIPDSSGFSSLPVQQVERFREGWLVAFDNGEFGGGLFMFPDTGLAWVPDRSNTSHMLRVGDTIYSAHGVNHMSLMRGHVTVHAPDKLRVLPEKLPAPSAVRELVEQNGRIAGRLDYGIMIIETDHSVHYNQFDIAPRLGFRPNSIGFLKSGDVWVGSRDVIAIFRDVPNISYPDVYLREDCELITN